MTQIFTLTDDSKQKKIEFCFWLDETIVKNKVGHNIILCKGSNKIELLAPETFDDIFLIEKDYATIDDTEYDLMYARNGGNGSLYLGYFNDGTV